MFLFKSKINFWLFLSIAVAVLFSFSGLKLAFASAYTVQDDARQHVFWMQRFVDGNLFSDDLIADYFSSIAPLGYKVLYWLANGLGLEPWLFNKILPVLLGAIATIYLFLVAIEIFPVPFAAFIVALLFNQNLWMLDDLVSGTPRAFFNPLFLAFIYYLLRQNLLLCLLAIVFQGLFYPQVVLISGAILAIRCLTIRNERSFCSLGLILSVGILAIYALQTSAFGDVITVEQAKRLPEFLAVGRNAFFLDSPLAFWLYGQRSGFFPREWQYVLLCSFGLCLPILKLYPRHFPLVNYIGAKAKIIWQILLASLLLFTLAHLFLFKLHLPSRYSQHTLRILIALVDGMAIAVIFQAISNRFTQHQKILRPLLALIIITVLLYPTYAVQAYPYRLGYKTGKTPELYQFLQQQPKNVLIASLSTEADFIPSLAQRRVLVAAEYSIPYHLGYYEQIRQRTRDLIQAQYSSNPKTLTDFIQQYDIDLWLVDRDAFTADYLQNNIWLRQFQPEIKQAIANLTDNPAIILNKNLDHCSIFSTQNSILVDAQCLQSSK